MGLALSILRGTAAAVVVHEASPQGPRFPICHGKSSEEIVLRALAGSGVFRAGHAGVLAGLWRGEVWNGQR